MQNLFHKKKSKGKNDSVISSYWAYCHHFLESKIMRAESASYFLVLSKSALLNPCLNYLICDGQFWDGQ